LRYLLANHRPPRPVVDTTRSHAVEHQLRYRYAGTDDEPGTRSPALDAKRLTLISGRSASVRQTYGMHEVQSDEQVRSAYDATADEYAGAFRCTEPEQPVELAMVNHFAGSLRGQRKVLDAGCGAGRFLPGLAGLCCEVEGLDLSPGMIRNARADHPSFATQVGTLRELPFEDASFDGYFSWYSTIHSVNQDLQDLLREAHRVLRPGGSILVAFQSGDGVQDLSESYRRRGYDLSLLRYLRSHERMALDLTSAGFTVTARLERGPVGDRELGNQAVLIATR
jgi:SAM-dependent methyltransferase